jgi:hypothetical protein
MDRDNIGSYGDARWAKARYSGTLDYNPDRGSPMVKPAQTGEFRPLPDVNENEREKAIRRVADAVHRMNEAIIRAVDQGVSVELVRVSRYHDGKGNWGDQAIPTVREMMSK